MQKKQFKHIDKIFMAEKQSPENEDPVDPYIVRAAPAKPVDENEVMMEDQNTPAFNN